MSVVCENAFFYKYVAVTTQETVTQTSKNIIMFLVYVSVTWLMH